MSLRELKVLLDQVARHAGADPAPRGVARAGWNALYDAWSDAHEETEDAWRTWRFGPAGREAYQRVPRGRRPRGRRAGRGRGARQRG